MIKFKAKIVDNQIKVPELKKSHCDMAFFRSSKAFGAYANSNLFPAILARIKRDRIGSILDLDNLPPNVQVDSSKYLASVTVTVEDTRN